MKTKRIKLKGWVLVVLKILLLINLFIMVCEAESLYIMFIKTIITMLISLVILYLLINYGGISDETFWL